MPVKTWEERKMERLEAKRQRVEEILEKAQGEQDLIDRLRAKVRAGLVTFKVDKSRR